MAKAWGWWTRHKLQILEKYLDAFARASSSQRERIYLDLFGGWPENRDRDSDEEILGSVHRALAAQPPFTRVGVFELEGKAALLEAELRRRYPHRRGITVYPGDCNVSITRALAELQPISWAPTFTFVDQFDCEIHWQTLKAVSRFRPPHLTKAEMWILFGTSFYPRGLNVRKPTMNANYAEAMTKMFGTEQWVPIVEALRRDELQPEEMREELLNLMRWRLEQELGYYATHPFTVKNTNGQDLYHMIFVSDHPVGNKIMQHLYGRALLEHEAMRQHALIHRRDRKRLEERGEDTLFPIDQSMIEVTETTAPTVYVAEPPHPPYRRRR